MHLARAPLPNYGACVLLAPQDPRATVFGLVRLIGKITQMPEFSPSQQKLIGWANVCSHSIAEAFETTLDALMQYSNPIVEYPVVLRRLLGSCHLTSESALILIYNNKLWDAETLLRSAIEGTSKFLYLCVGNETTNQTRFDEYYNQLPEINRLKRNHRLTDFLAQLPNPDEDEWKPFRDLLLSAKDEEQLETLYPRSARKQMEHRWSFHSIANSFYESGIPELALFKHLFFGYGQGSHVLHQDSDGVNMLWERNERSEDRRTSIEVAHGAREISDLLVMAFLRYLTTLHLCGEDLQPAIDFFSQQQHLFDEFHLAQDTWRKIEYPE